MASLVAKQGRWQDLADPSTVAVIESLIGATITAAAQRSEWEFVEQDEQPEGFILPEVELVLADGRRIYICGRGAYKLHVSED